MRILLLACEFPPMPAPQSLRWGYLARELTRRGHDVHVLTPRTLVPRDGIESSGVRVHETSPGPFRATMHALQRGVRRGRGVVSDDEVAPMPSPPYGSSGLNWKGRALRSVDRMLDRCVFPDSRGEWKLPARVALGRVLAAVEPDVVVSSHEPATTLELGLAAKRRGLRWLADLGDPILAGYTPARWRRRAQALERDVLARADALTVTSRRFADALSERYPAHAHKIHVVTQGFDDRMPRATTARTRHPVRGIRLLYTGSFYPFRRAEPLLEAVVGFPHAIEIEIATHNAPASVVSFAERFPAKVRLLGALGHEQTLEKQREADVLVNIANDNALQIPGKFYEYLGAGNPILHVSEGRDEAAALVEANGWGWTTSNETRSISGALALAYRRLSSRQGFDFSGAGAYAWSALARRMEGVLEGVVA